MIVRIKNTNVEVFNTNTNKVEYSTNIYSLKTSISTDTELDNYQNYVVFNDEYILDYSISTDEGGNAFATVDDLLDYTIALHNSIPDLGEATSHGNMKISSLGDELIFENQNTGEKTLNIYAEVTSNGTRQVVYKNQEESQVNETPLNAYNGIYTDQKTSIANAQGRHVIALDVLSDGDKLVQEYRSKIYSGSITNGNIKIFNIKTQVDGLSGYKDLTGVNIESGLHISIRAYWKAHEDTEIENNGGFNLGTGDVSLPFNNNEFNLVGGEMYRFVISSDTEFTMEGDLSGATPTGTPGATQFIPYLERSYVGNTKTEVLTRAPRYYSGAINFTKDVTNTTIFSSQGDEWGVNIVRAYNDPDAPGTICLAKVQDGVIIDIIYKGLNDQLITIDGSAPATGIDNVVDKLNELFSQTQAGVPTGIVSPIVDPVGTSVTLNTYRLHDPAGDPILGTAPGFNYGVAWSNETISETGEHFDILIQFEGQIGFGVYNATTDNTGSGIPDHLEQLQNGVGTNRYLGHLFSHWFHPSPDGPWTNYGQPGFTGYSQRSGWTSSTYGFRYNDEYTDWNAGNPPVLIRVRIGHDSHLYISYYNSLFDDYIDIVRTSYSLADNVEYGLFIGMGDSNVRVYQAPTIHEVDVLAPNLAWRYIHSLGYRYPLFSSEEEANYVDVLNGGSGQSDARTFGDDPTFSTWYSPRTGYVTDGAVAPASTTDITYVEIASQEDEAFFTPVAFTDTTINVNEFGNVNLQVIPTGSNWTTELLNVPTWLSLVNENVTGIAPEVTGDNVTNPSDDYVVTIKRTKGPYFSTGDLTITVNNLTAPVVIPISGFTHVAGSTAQPTASTMGDGTVMEYNDDLEDIRRLTILKSYVSQNILPSLTQAGDKYIIGHLNSGADVSTLEVADFDFAIVWEYVDGTDYKFLFYRDNVELHSLTVTPSGTDPIFDFAIELQGSDVWLIACNVLAINSQPSPEYGGQFTWKFKTTSIDGSAPLTINIGNIGSDSTIATTDLTEIVVPRPNWWVQVTSQTHVLSFDGASTMPTFNAGDTYRLLMGQNEYDDQVTNTGIHVNDVIRFTADGTTEYTGMTVTRVGTIGTNGSYIEFTIPTDVPPLWWYTDQQGINQNNAVTTSGSTYVVPVTGITLEGPVANQTGTNLFDVGDHGWLSIDETLSAGERLVLDNAFMVDLVDAMPDNSAVSVGIKDGAWTDSSDWDAGFEGGFRLTIVRYSSSDVRIYIVDSPSITNTYYTNVANVASNNLEAFIEITNSGNNIRGGYRADDSASSSNVSSTTYSNWDTNNKVQTGDQGYGITSIDVMIQGRDLGSSGSMDTANVDWTGLSEISIPTAPATLTTSWNKFVSFEGGNNYAYQVNPASNSQPMRQRFIAPHSLAQKPTNGMTSSVSTSQPFHGMVVFRADALNNGNQVILGQHEGAGTGDDQIVLALENATLAWRWGRQDVGKNQCTLISNISANTWYALYFSFSGWRGSGTDATATNLNDTFKFQLVDRTSGVVTAINPTWTDTGYRMDRETYGDFSVGGRNANRSFKGDISAVVIESLLQNASLLGPSDISKFVRDPEQFFIDHRLGVTWRIPNLSTPSFTYAYDHQESRRAFQGWLMGDGPMDSYSNMIRNFISPSDQNDSMLRLQGLTSGQLQTSSTPIMG